MIYYIAHFTAPSQLINIKNAYVAADEEENGRGSLHCLAIELK